MNISKMTQHTDYTANLILSLKCQTNQPGMIGLVTGKAGEFPVKCYQYKSMLRSTTAMFGICFPCHLNINRHDNLVSTFDKFACCRARQHFVQI